MGIFARFQYFDHWTEEQRRECFARAKVIEFRPDQTIFVEGRSTVNYVHLVLSGQCAVLQCLKLIKVLGRSGKYRYSLADARPIGDEIAQFHGRKCSSMVELVQSTKQSNGTTPLSPGRTTPNNDCTPMDPSINYEFHFIDVATYSCGSVFGVGEHMDDRMVTARDRVQCLLIPRYWLLQKPQNVNNVWSRIRIFLEQRQPSRNKLFIWFLDELRWKKYRHQLKEDWASVHAAKNPTTFCNVPALCRIQQSDIFA
ncbi:uncharacterized protein LOC129763272 [Toxorhynchites rutilus septentrionalis]|uniref:uncharacterized protein LOC129763272 n=1 Tax=Toxorhynchites rutilus septentrionalis TaxID=329112 RepID=UPI00247A1364|nr:uncharacterized protein LOC129763272 [Toxorhynchites rutilus septentrionalis]